MRVQLLLFSFGLIWLAAAESGRASDTPPFHMQAHRGAGIAMPENTLETFRWSWERGVTPEADLRTTKDGEIVCFHDANFKRVVKPGSPKLEHQSIEDSTLEELQPLDVGAFRGKQFSGQRIPTLVSVFKEMQDRPERLLYIDIKQADPDSLAKLVQQCGVERQVIFTTPKYELIQVWKKLVPESMTLIWNGGTQSELAKKIAALRAKDFDGITHLQVHVHVEDLDAEEPFKPQSDFIRSLGEELEKRGIVFQVLPWECNDPRAYEQLLKLGVDSFATDYPEVTLQAVKTFRDNQQQAEK